MIETINKLVRTSRQMLHLQVGRDPPRKNWPNAWPCRWKRCARSSRSPRSRSASRRRSATRKNSPSGRFVIQDPNVVLPIDAAIQANLREGTTQVLATLTQDEERVLRMRFGIGMKTDARWMKWTADQRDPRAHPRDRSQGAAQAQASVPLQETPELPRQLTRVSKPALLTTQRDMAIHKDQKFSDRMSTAAKARAEMLAKAKARAEAAKATADERGKERAAIAAATRRPPRPSTPKVKGTGRARGREAPSEARSRCTPSGRRGSQVLALTSTAHDLEIYPDTAAWKLRDAIAQAYSLEVEAHCGGRRRLPALC